MNLTSKNKKYLLNQSRKALEYYFQTGKRIVTKEATIPLELLEKRATFVTLTKNGELRGCIGKIIPVQALYKDVIENTYSAALDDYRFSEVSKEELSKIQIEISILDIPKKIDYKNAEDLLNILLKNKFGVLITFQGKSATFLPQVWDELNNASEFLNHLCAKAGLSEEIWKNEKIEVQVYNVEKFSEE